MAKATKWQMNFFIALMTSKMSFELFYSKQFNKQMLDQFIHRFFPRLSRNSVKTIEHIIKKKQSENKEVERNIELEEVINFLEKEKLITPRKLEMGCYIEFNKKILLKSISNTFDRFYYNDSLESRDSNHILTLYFENDEHHISYATSQSCIKKFNSFVKNTNYGTTLTRIALETSREGYEKIHDVFIRIFCEYLRLKNNYCYYPNSSYVFTKTQIKKCKDHSYMNIGLEFEYDRQDSQVMTEEEMLKFDSKYLISLSSGYDGSSDTKTIYSTEHTEMTYHYNCKDGRLNEDRLRLNGIKGFIPLYDYLLHLNKHGMITENSSIHIHIDCDYDKTYHEVEKTYKSDKSSLHKYLNRVKNPSLIEIICIGEEGRLYNEKGYFTFRELSATKMIQRIIRINDLGTLEFRGFKPSFQYEDVVMYILVASYITRCIKRGLKINEEIIKTIIKANKIVKKRKLEVLT